MKLSVLVPSLTGEVPQSLRDQVSGCDDVELIVVAGVSPVGKARNEGLRRATGDYIAWVDSDDEVAENWLSEIRAALEDAPDVVTFDAELVGWEGRRDCVWGVAERQATAERLRLDVYRDICRPSWLCLYVTRRVFWGEGCFDGSVRMAEDYLVLPRILARATSCRYVPRRLYRYVRSANSVSNTQSAVQNAELIGIWERRFAECPPEYRSVCRWGLAVSAYWVCALQARAPEPADAQACANARRCRRLIRGSFPALVREAFAAPQLSFAVRASWTLRFASAVTNLWFIQKLRHGRCAA